MRYQVGQLTLDDGEASLNSVERRSVYTPRGHRFLIQETHNVSGEIIPPATTTTVAAQQKWIANRIRQIEVALEFEPLDRAGLLNADGSRTMNYMDAPGSASGIRIVKPLSFGKIDEADGLSGRSFSFALQSEYIPKGAATLFDFREVITWEGDTGPQFVGVELDAGPPDVQQVRQQTIQTISQRGSAVGIGSYPAFPPAAYPSLPQASKPVRDRSTPRRRGLRDTLFPISWSFSFISAVNQFGVSR